MASSPVLSRSLRSRRLFRALRVGLIATALASTSACLPACGPAPLDPTSATYAAGHAMRRVALGAGEVDVALWYPTDPDAAAETRPAAYDFVVARIDSTRAAHRPPVADGAFPLVLFAHGTGAFHAQSWSIAELLAQRGFIVVATNRDDAQTFGVPGNSQIKTGLTGPALLAALFKHIEAKRDADPVLQHADLDTLFAAGQSLGAADAVALANNQTVPVRAVGVLSWPAAPATTVPTVVVSGDTHDRLGGVTGVGADSPCVWRRLHRVPHSAFANICDISDALGTLAGVFYPQLVKEAAESCADGVPAPAHIHTAAADALAQVFYTTTGHTTWPAEQTTAPDADAWLSCTADVPRAPIRCGASADGCPAEPSCPDGLRMALGDRGCWDLCVADAMCE